MVDLRPDFTPDRGSITGFVPVIQMRITTDAKDLERSEVVFQLNIASLTKLETFVADARRKIEQLSRERVLAGLLVSENDAVNPGGEGA